VAFPNIDHFQATQHTDPPSMPPRLRHQQQSRAACHNPDSDLLRNKPGFAKDGKIIASTEKGIFEALGMDYVPPEERE